MKVYKFGGASVKDAQGIRNLCEIIKQKGSTHKVIVISAMGKMTNAFENLIVKYLNPEENPANELLKIKSFHFDICNELFPSTHPIFETLNHGMEKLNIFFLYNKSTNYNFVYDQVIGYGELFSTQIVSAYLTFKNISNTWLDVREVIKTDDFYRRANVNWDETKKLIKAKIDPNKLTIVQGFLGSDKNNFSTSLGREGSDYTAAIMAFNLNAQDVTIWKDVPGLLNADPRHFENAVLLHQISYHDAIELAFYGASVIHPKTLQPLQNKEIPLCIKSFVNPESEGTIVGKGTAIKPDIPCYIVKKNQVLLTVSSLDFSYMVEQNIGAIFKVLQETKMKIDLIQNSAISLSVCFEDNYNNLEILTQKLKAKFKVKVHKSVDLYTIHNYTQKSIDKITKNKNILNRQVSLKTFQVVVFQ